MVWCIPTGLEGSLLDHPTYRRRRRASHCVIGVQIFLVGTAHVSRDSASEVRQLISVVRPSTIMVELCRKRADKLRSSPKVQCLLSNLACEAVPGLL